MIKLLEFDRIEFEGIDGRIHAIRQCSLLDRAELKERIEMLRDRMTASPDQSIGEFYDSDPFFRAWVDRALELCGIDPAWVGLREMIALLFPHRNEANEIEQGWLIALNFAPPKGQTKPGQKPQTVEEIIAIISTYCESLDEALRLAKEQPAGRVQGILEARAAIAHEQRLKYDKAYAEQHHKQKAQTAAINAIERLSAKLFEKAQREAHG